MTKAARILELYAKGLTTREIADRVGCKPEYVRVVARQRKDGPSRADKRYAASPKGEVRRERKRQRFYDVYHAVPKAERSKTFAEVYYAARSAGKSVRDALRLSASAISRRAWELAKSEDAHA